MRVFIGYDVKESVAYHVLVQSILDTATEPISITPIKREMLAGIYRRERGPLESTDFSLTRFLVPYLSGYEGWSLYMDCDMLALDDITKLALDQQVNTDKSVLVCKHDYVPRQAIKMDQQLQTAYVRKNWSSLMLFNNTFCRALSPSYVASASGLALHRFQWCGDDGIGGLDLSWNYLVGEDGQAKTPRVVHFTNGGPWLLDYTNVEYAEEWRNAARRAGLRG